MKNRITALLIAFISIASFGYAQNSDVQLIKLEQVPGAFTTESLTLTEGTYQFEIFNNNIDHEVGFVLAPEGKVDPESHIKEAYVKETVKTNKSSLTSEVNLTKGSYVYFCPLNPTEQYKLTVRGANDAKIVRLEQTPGEFTIQDLTLAEGTYQFEIVNNNVDHEIGFVLAPEGKFDPESHIKEAYVKETVKTGQSSLTSEVVLKKGTYNYFCPLNPTEKYTLTVK